MTPAHLHDLPAPSRLALPPRGQAAAIAAAATGAAALAWAFGRGDTQLAWSAYLIGAFFALGLGIFGLAWIAILYLAGGTWAVTMRRIPEAMTAWLVPGGVLSLLVVFGAGSLYLWSRAELVAIDELLTHKSPFLNLRMFAAMVGGSFAIWAAFAAIIVGGSRRQDRLGTVAITRTNRAMSALFMVLFALTASVVSFYLILSLEAHWFSTMFAVLVFTDVMQTGTAFVAIVAGTIVMRGTLRGFLNEHHLHSLGKMLFAWTGFWSYIYFCQFMLIWYANIPEETTYFLKRVEHGWLPYMLALPLLKFVVPFVLLLPRDAKRNPRRLVPLAALVLAAQFLELYVMVAPALGHGPESPAHAHLPVVESLVTIGFLGLFVAVFGWSLSRHDPVPLKDPGLGECLHYHS